MLIDQLTPAILRKAANLKERIEELEKELNALLEGKSAPAASRGKPAGKKTAGRRKKRTMSPEARERIADAQRKRWAKTKSKAGKKKTAKKKTARKKTARKKRNLSPEARAKIAEAQRKRWAKVKAKKS